MIKIKIIGDIRFIMANDRWEKVKYSDSSAVDKGVERKIETDVSGRKMVNKTEI